MIHKLFLNLLLKIEFLDSLLTDEQKDDLWKRMFSYNAHIAVYNPHNNQVETLYYDNEPLLLEEMKVDESHNQKITQMILDNCSFLDETKDTSEWDLI